MVCNNELKENARRQLGGNVISSTWLLLAIAYIVISAVISTSTVFIVGPILIVGPITISMARILINSATTNTDVDLAELLHGFKNDISGNILLGFMYSLFIFLWSLLFVIPGIIKTYSYSMCFYIKNDNPEKDWKECLNESQIMMYGHRWQLFLLDLSFIGWYIVGALCFGIGTYFVIPYHQMSYANFYLALKAQRV